MTLLDMPSLYLPIAPYSLTLVDMPSRKPRPMSTSSSPPRTSAAVGARRVTAIGCAPPPPGGPDEVRRPSWGTHLARVRVGVRG